MNTESKQDTVLKNEFSVTGVELMANEFFNSPKFMLMLLPLIADEVTQEEKYPNDKINNFVNITKILDSFFIPCEYHRLFLAHIKKMLMHTNKTTKLKFSGDYKYIEIVLDYRVFRYYPTELNMEE